MAEHRDTADASAAIVHVVTALADDDDDAYAVVAAYKIVESVETAAAAAAVCVALVVALVVVAVGNAPGFVQVVGIGVEAGSVHAFEVGAIVAGAAGAAAVGVVVGGGGAVAVVGDGVVAAACVNVVVVVVMAIVQVLATAGEAFQDASAESAEPLGRVIHHNFLLGLALNLQCTRLAEAPMDGAMVMHHHSLRDHPHHHHHFPISCAKCSGVAKYTRSHCQDSLLAGRHLWHLKFADMIHRACQDCTKLLSEKDQFEVPDCKHAASPYVAQFDSIAHQWNTKSMDSFHLEKLLVDRHRMPNDIFVD